MRIEVSTQLLRIYIPFRCGRLFPSNVDSADVDRDSVVRSCETGANPGRWDSFWERGYYHRIPRGITSGRLIHHEVLLYSPFRFDDLPMWQSAYLLTRG